jgi:kinesin family member 18/19
MSLGIREDPLRGVTVYGAHEVMVSNVEDIMQYLSYGNKNRTKESTFINEASSRSHAVLTVTVERKERVSLSNDVHHAKFLLIDLAGSERAAGSKNRGMRIREGGNINKSLLSLGNCITALSDRSLRGKQVHVPYRDSKLTRILKVLTKILHNKFCF